MILITNYGKLTYEQIAQMLPGRTWMAVRNHANVLDLTGTSNLGRKYCANKEYFSIPNVENSYWAGFLAADGNIQTGRKRLSIGLHIKDVAHIERLRNALEYTGKVYRYEKVASLEISCPKIVDDLERNFNIHSRKSFTLQPPPLTDESMIGAFIAGLIDGDGSIVINPPPMVGPRIAIYGTQSILEWIQGYFDKWTPVTNYRRASVRFVSEHHLYIYRVSGKRAIDIAKRILRLDLPVLKRKWNVIKDYL